MLRSEESQAVRDEPSFSLNGLMRYLHTKPAGRARITGDQKRPSDIAASYYDPAAAAIRRFVVKGMKDEAILTRAAARLAAVSEFDESRVNALANIEALDAFRASYRKLDFRGLTPSRGKDAKAWLRIGGVRVNVRPEIALGGIVRGEPRAGALTLYFSKGHPLPRTSAEYGAALVKRYCEERLAGGAKVRPEDCSIFEVRTGEIYHAPSSAVRRMKEIEAACEEIALRWPTA
jgi:hypothetical protein